MRGMQVVGVPTWKCMNSKKSVAFKYRNRRNGWLSTGRLACFRWKLWPPCAGTGGRLCSGICGHFDRNMQQPISRNIRPCIALRHVIDTRVRGDQLIQCHRRLPQGHHIRRSMMFRSPNAVEIIETGTPQTFSISSMKRRVSSDSCSYRNAALFFTSR